MQYNLYYSCLTEDSEQLLKKKYGDRIPLAAVAKSVRYRNWQDRAAALAGKALLLEALSRYGYPENVLYHIKCTPYGKPFIDDKVHFNLSHSGNMVVCCATFDGELGLDLEQITSVDLGDFSTIFSDEEWLAVENSAIPLESFYDFWTMKESICKADGRGLSLDPSMIEILTAKVELDNSVWHLKKIDDFPGYSCHLAALEMKPDLVIEEINLVP